MKTIVTSANSMPTGVQQAPNNNSATVASLIVPSITITPKVEPETDLQFTTPSSSGGASKRPASLDLNKPKKQRLVAPTPLVLESPDLLANMKTINTPDIEKLLLSSNLLQTPQPGVIFPPKVGAQVTSEQEAFGKGFDEALHSLYNSNKNAQAQQVNNSVNSSVASVSSNNSSSASVVSNTITSTTVQAAVSTTGTAMSGGSFTYTNLETNFPIKDEPQTSASPAPVSPIDMETQEKIKLERKRQRNRVAASKCRKRKLERISKLEDKVKQLKGENTDLGQVVKALKDHVAQLKQQVMTHLNVGCNISIYQNK